MCSAWATIAPVGVEQRGRAVAALLDVGGVGAADQHRAHLLGDARERAREHARVTGSRLTRALQHQRAGVVDAPPSPGARARRLGELDDRRALDLEARAHARRGGRRGLDPLAVEVGAALAGVAVAVGLLGAARARSTGTVATRRALTSSTGLAVHPVAVALLVGLVEALRERVEVVGLDGQLERLAAVAQVGAAAQRGVVEVLAARASSSLREASLERRSLAEQRRGRSRAARRRWRARARSARRRRAARAPRAIPSSSASAQACSRPRRRRPRARTRAGRARARR